MKFKQFEVQKTENNVLNTSIPRLFDQLQSIFEQI